MATVEARIAALMRQMSQEQNNCPGVMVLLADGTRLEPVLNRESAE